MNQLRKSYYKNLPLPHCSDIFLWLLSWVVYDKIYPWVREQSRLIKILWQIVYYPIALGCVISTLLTNGASRDCADFRL